MEPYKAKKLELNYSYSNDILKLLNETMEVYGEYKGYLKNMSFDYNNFLNCLFVNETYYSFKIDNIDIKKDDMFYMPYKNKSNTTIEFINMRKALIVGLTESNKTGFDTLFFNKINKIIYSNCKKDNNTKKSGLLRKKQTFLLKPGLAGSSVSYIPPRYTELPKLMGDLSEYLNENLNKNLVSVALSHYQFEKLHPYLSGNGLMGRLLIPIETSYYKNEPPLLFISESLYNLKNTYFTLLSDSDVEQNEKFIKFFLQCVIEQCYLNIKKIKLLNKIYNNDIEKFKKDIGGTTIYKVYPIMIKKIVFTVNDIVTESRLHINSVNKVLNKLVLSGYLIKEKKKGTNRVTYCYKNMYDVFVN